ncbi:MAG: TIGR03032 family protein [Sphingobacteriaceae bacterium]|nr:TIGR03032 family protein [Sphingobacteriaceae bacterium]
MDQQTPNNIGLAPFSCTFTPQLSELLFKLKCSIAITTYQAGKLIFISPVDENRITQLPRDFNKPMGFEIAGDKMILATKDEVHYFENSPELAKHYPNKKDTYDSLFLPRTTFYTGQVDMHDVAMGTDGVWAINTSFSCLAQVTGNFNFIPRWQPPFISNLVSEDRCHLNGLVMVNGKPKYVTALGTTDTHQGWRENIVSGGVLMDVETNEIILDKLPMPHSPMIYKGEFYMLLSASGELVKVNLKEKKYEVIKKLDGFCRGMDAIGDYMCVAMSKLRKNSSTFAKLPFAKTADVASIKVIHLPTQAIVGELTYQTSVDEIYSLKILKDSIRPNILNTINPLHKYSLSIPGQTFWANPDTQKQ